MSRSDSTGSTPDKGGYSATVAALMSSGPEASEASVGPSGPDEYAKLVAASLDVVEGDGQANGRHGGELLLVGPG